MYNSGQNEIYRSPKRLSYVVLALFGGIGICSIVYILMGLVILAFPDAQFDLDEAVTMHFGMAAVALTGVLELLFRLAVTVLFLIWIYRAYKNLFALQATMIDTTPGWAVGYWFVPVLNLFKPYQVVSEIWTESDPEIDSETSLFKAGGSAPNSLILWWILFLASGFAGIILDRLGDSDAALAGKVDAFTVGLIIASVLQLGAVILVMMVVHGITKRQDERNLRMGIPLYEVPPPPTSFV